MKTRYFKSVLGLVGTLFVTGVVLAAQPQSIAAAGEINFSDKPHAPVDVSYRFQSTPEVGQPLVIDLEFSAAGGSRILDTSYRSEPELMISDREQARQISRAGVDSAVSQTITTIPQANGLYHLSVFASVWVNDRLVRRVVSLPVQVGPKSDSLIVADKLTGIEDIDGVPIKALSVRTTITQK